jgi:dihydrofolate reductase
MGIVLWHVALSLDGFIAGPNDDVRWAFEYEGPSEATDEVIRTTGALIVGRRTYEVEDRERPGFYGGAWKGPFFVLTHDPPANPPDWMTGTFVDDEIGSVVTGAKVAASDQNVVVLGADIARQCIEAGLLDEILVSITPVLLGDGVRFFERHGGEPIRLERIAVAEAGELTDLRFRVLKKEDQ